MATNDDKIMEELEKFYRIKDKRKETAYLWKLADENIAPMLYSRCSIYIDMFINDIKVRCLLDTGAESNVISKKLVDELDISYAMDDTRGGNIEGVGGQQTKHGTIPYFELKTHNNVICPVNLTVIDYNEQIILGLPFMMFYHIKLDFENRKASIMGDDLDMIIVER